MKTPSPAPPFPSSSTLITIPPSHYLLNKLRKLSMLRASPPSRDNGGGGDFLQRAERLGLEGGGGGGRAHPTTATATTITITFNICYTYIYIYIHIYILYMYIYTYIEHNCRRCNYGLLLFALPFCLCRRDGNKFGPSMISRLSAVSWVRACCEGAPHAEQDGR